MVAYLTTICEFLGSIPTEGLGAEPGEDSWKPSTSEEEADVQGRLVANGGGDVWDVAQLVGCPSSNLKC